MVDRLSVVYGDITKVDDSFDAIVCPSNSYGTMGGGVALAIRNAGGQVIEDEAVDEAPIDVGRAVLTSAGRLACPYVIHASTMVEPVELIGGGNVLMAVTAALDLARNSFLKKLAFPGMGTGYGGVEYSLAADIMVSTISDFLEKNVDFEVVIYAVDEGLYREFERLV